VGRNPPKNLPKKQYGPTRATLIKYTKKDPMARLRQVEQAKLIERGIRKANEIEMTSLNIPVEEKVRQVIQSTEDDLGRNLDSDEISALTMTTALADERLRKKYKKSFNQIKKEFAKAPANEQAGFLDQLAEDLLAQIGAELVLEETIGQPPPYSSSESVSLGSPPSYTSRAVSFLSEQERQDAEDEAWIQHQEAISRAKKSGVAGVSFANPSPPPTAVVDSFTGQVGVVPGW
jgi:hypothetical protein